MPKKLNDTQVLEIVTKHANGTSISALAREYGIARTTITRYIEQNADLLQKCAKKKEETVTGVRCCFLWLLHGFFAISLHFFIYNRQVSCYSIRVE